MKIEEKKSAILKIFNEYEGYEKDSGVMIRKEHYEAIANDIITKLIRSKK